MLWNHNGEECIVDEANCLLLVQLLFDLEGDEYSLYLRVRGGCGGVGAIDWVNSDILFNFLLLFGVVDSVVTY